MNYSSELTWCTSILSMTLTSANFTWKIAPETILQPIKLKTFLGGGHAPRPPRRWGCYICLKTPWLNPRSATEDNSLFSFFITGQPYFSNTWQASCTTSAGLVDRTWVRWFANHVPFRANTEHSSAVRRCLVKSSFSAGGWE